MLASLARVKGRSTPSLRCPRSLCGIFSLPPSLPPVIGACAWFVLVLRIAVCRQSLNADFRARHCRSSHPARCGRPAAYVMLTSSQPERISRLLPEHDPSCVCVRADGRTGVGGAHLPDPDCFDPGSRLSAGHRDPVVDPRESWRRVSVSALPVRGHADGGMFQEDADGKRRVREPHSFLSSPPFLLSFFHSLPPSLSLSVSLSLSFFLSLPMTLSLFLLCPSALPASFFFLVPSCILDPIWNPPQPPGCQLPKLALCHGELAR